MGPGKAAPGEGGPDGAGRGGAGVAELLIVRLFADDSEPVEWIAVDTTGARRGPLGRGTLAEAAAAAGERRVQVLLPAADVVMTSAEIPARGAKLLQALPFALEEQFAEDVEGLHFAAGQRRASGRTPVAAIARERLDAWLERLREGGIAPAAAYSEADGLARLPGTVSVMLDRGQVLINDGDSLALVLDGVGPGDALAAVGALDDPGEGEDDAAGDMPRHVLVYCTAADNERYEAEWAALRAQLESLEVRLLPDGALPRLAVTVASGAGVNLLQGAYAPKSAFGAAWRPWRVAAMLALALTGVLLAARAADYLALQRLEKTLEAEAVAALQRAMPWVGAVDDPRARLRSELARLGADPQSAASRQFLDTLAALGEAMRGAGEVRIEGISYRAGVMDIRLEAPDVPALDRIVRRVNEAGALIANIQNTDRQEDSIKGRIQIKGAGA